LHTASSTGWKVSSEYNKKLIKTEGFVLRILFLLLIPTAGFPAETNIAKQMTVDLQLVIYGAILLLSLFLMLKNHYRSKVLKYKDLTDSLSTQLDEVQSLVSQSDIEVSRLQAESIELTEQLKDSQIRYKDLTNSLSTQLDEALSLVSQSDVRISRLQAESIELTEKLKDSQIKYKDLTNSLSTQLDEAQSLASQSSLKISRLQAKFVELAEKLTNSQRRGKWKDSQIKEYRAKELLNTKNKKSAANYSPETPKKDHGVKAVEAWIFEPDLLQHESPSTQEILRHLKVGSLLSILPKQVNTDFRAYQVVTEDGHVLAVLKNNISIQLGPTVEFSYLATIISMRGTSRRNFQCKMSIALRPVDLSHIRIKSKPPVIKQPVKHKHKRLTAEELAKLGSKLPAVKQPVKHKHKSQIIEERATVACKPPVERQIATIAEVDAGKNKETLEIQVVGVTFPNNDGSSRQEALQHLAIGDLVRVIAEPYNPHHKNAFKVVSNFGQVGYLPRSFADNLSKENKSQFEAKIKAVGASSKGSLGARILLTPHPEGGGSDQNSPHVEQNRRTRVTSEPFNKSNSHRTETGDDGSRREWDYDPVAEERDAYGLNDGADTDLDFGYIDDSDYNGH